MTNRHTLDIFQVLAQLNTKQVTFYQLLTDKEAKSIAPIVLTRWLTGTYNKQQVFVINEVVNPYIFSLYHHPVLLWYLMTIGTSGTNQRYFWNKPSKGIPKDNACIQCIKDYFNYNTKDAELVYHTIDHTVILDMAEELGYQDSEMAKIKKELGFSVSLPKKPRSSRKKTEIQQDTDIDFIF